MFDFPKNCLPARAAFLAVLALSIALFANIPAAHAALMGLSEPVNLNQNCGDDDCLYIPAVISENSGQSSPDSVTRSQMVSLYREMYLPSNNTNVGWDGKHDPCNPGGTSQAFRNSVLVRVNYFRKMAGIPVLEGMRANLNIQEQEAALMMSRNKSLSHTPPSTWACSTSGGQEAAGKSNLALGANGPAAIDLYMNDYGLSSLGHRRWLLYPQTRWAATGDIPAADGYPATNAFRIYDDNLWGARPQTRDPFVAWPPATYVPYQVVYPYWSFAYPGADFSRATVQVTSGGNAVALTKYPQVDGFGENALVWSINGMGNTPWPKPSGDTAYQVQIRGVIVQGNSRDFNYTVTVIDPDR